MGSVSFARSLLIFGAYLVNSFLGLALLGVAIFLLQQIPELPSSWMPEGYNPANRLANTSKREYRKEVWRSMSDNEKVKARKDRIVNIVVYIVYVAIFSIVAYLVVRYVFPALVDFAKTI